MGRPGDPAQRLDQPRHNLGRRPGSRRSPVTGNLTEWAHAFFAGGGVPASGGMNALRILVIEDEARLANAIKQGLVEEDFAVEIAGSAEAAEPIIARGALDLIVLDVGLPGKGGLDLLREMRVAGNHTPVLILTARGALAERVAG